MKIYILKDVLWGRLEIVLLHDEFLVLCLALYTISNKTYTTGKAGVSKRNILLTGLMFMPIV
jgi:hypothetical protein